MASSIHIYIFPYKTETDKQKSLTCYWYAQHFPIDPFCKSFCPYLSQVTNVHLGVPPCWPAQSEALRDCQNPATATEASSYSQEKNNVHDPGLLISISYTPSLHLQLLIWTWKLLWWCTDPETQSLTHFLHGKKVCILNGQKSPQT